MIGCECSGIVRDALRAIGIDAWSCDLKPCEKGSPYHIQGDVMEAIKSREQWSMIGLHPECTCMTVSGNHVYALGKPRHHERVAAVEWTVALWDLARSRSAHGYLENPMGVLPTMGGMKGYQQIQPYDFGEDASKNTCLWLWGLPPLQPTKYHPGQYACKCGYRFEEILGAYGCANCEGDSGPAKLVWGNQTASGQNRLAPGPNRKADRSRTYPGIAQAFADQWGRLVLKKHLSTP